MAVTVNRVALKLHVAARMRALGRQRPQLAIRSPEDHNPPARKPRISPLARPRNVIRSHSFNRGLPLRVKRILRQPRRQIPVNRIKQSTRPGHRNQPHAPQKTTPLPLWPAQYAVRRPAAAAFALHTNHTLIHALFHRIVADHPRLFGQQLPPRFATASPRFCPFRSGPAPRPCAPNLPSARAAVHPFSADPGRQVNMR